MEHESIIRAVIETLNGTALRVDQFDQAIRLKACINQLRGLLESASQSETVDEAVNGEG